MIVIQSQIYLSHRFTQIYTDREREVLFDFIRADPSLAVAHRNAVMIVVQSQIYLGQDLHKSTGIQKEE